MAYEFRATAHYLAKAAAEGRLVTYGELSDQFGGVPMGWGPTLTEMVHRLHKHKLPLLPVIVVASGSDLPSIDANVYRQIGIGDAESIREEQRRCFEFDWRNSALMK